MRLRRLLFFFSLFSKLLLDTFKPPGAVFRVHVRLLPQIQLTIMLKLELLFHYVIVSSFKIFRTLTGEKSLP